MVTRDFITSIHKIMPIILQNDGFDIGSYEENEAKKGGNLSVREYKKAMEKEKAELELKNREKAYEVINQQERSR